MRALATPLKILAAAALWAGFCRLLLDVTGNSAPALMALAVLFCIGFMWTAAAVGSSVRDANALTSYWVIMLGAVGGGLAVLFLILTVLGL